MRFAIYRNGGKEGILYVSRLGVVGLLVLVFTSSASSKRVFESNSGEPEVESEDLSCMMWVRSADRG